MTSDKMIIIGVYVYDIILAGKDTERINKVKMALSQKFQIKDLGELHYFLGVQVIQDTKNSSIWMGHLRSQNLFLTNME